MYILVEWTKLNTNGCGEVDKQIQRATGSSNEGDLFFLHWYELSCMHARTSW